MKEGVSLVEGVRHDVDQGQPEGSQTALEHHESHLRDGGIGQGPFHRGLGQHHDGPKPRRQGTNNG